MAELHPVSDFNHPCPVMRMNIACELGVFTNCFSGDVTAATHDATFGWQLWRNQHLDSFLPLRELSPKLNATQMESQKANRNPQGATRIP